MTLNSAVGDFGHIGFVGLDSMGKPMVMNLLRAGFDVAVSDLRSERVKELEQMGARAALSQRYGCDMQYCLRHGYRRRSGRISCAWTRRTAWRSHSWLNTRQAVIDVTGAAGFNIREMAPSISGDVLQARTEPALSFDYLC